MRSVLSQHNEIKQEILDIIYADLGQNIRWWNTVQWTPLEGRTLEQAVADGDGEDALATLEGFINGDFL